MNDEKDKLTGREDEGAKKEKKKKKRGKHKKHKKNREEDSNEKEGKNDNKKSTLSNDQFIINGNYNLIKMLGFGAFGEIHLAYDTSLKVLRAIKFEIATHKNPQLKHEHSILEQLNKPDNNNPISSDGVLGIPKVYLFDRMENKYNYMVMDFLGPSLSDLFQFKEKSFSLETTLMLGIQMLTRIEFIHEKGFIHRDIKPENFVIGLNERSNIVHIIDFGLSKRYKDKNTGQHIPYRENRHLVGTVRYASINAHLGIEQSRRDDIESIGYVLAYFYLGRLPWQSKMDKGKPPVNKIMEKKLITPPEILCKKMPFEFQYYFHYCRNLKFEDRPDYSMLKSVFAKLLFSKIKMGSIFVYDWFDDKKKKNKSEDDNQENIIVNNNNNKDIDKPSIFKTPNYNDNETANPDNDNNSNNNLLDKYNKNNEMNKGGKANDLFDKFIKNSEKQEVPIGIVVQDKKNDEESKSSVSDSYSDSEKSKEDEKSEESNNNNNNKNSSDSNYGILNKSDSDSKKGDKENNQ